jgi:two-component system response regulator FixJ
VSASCFPAVEDFLAETKVNSSFDCVVTDVRMPGLSGIDLIREMAALGKSTPIILITAFGEVEMAVAAIKLGAFDYLEKPFDEQRLLKSIQNALGRAPEGHDEYADLKELRVRAGTLSDRQREVMELAATGWSRIVVTVKLQSGISGAAESHSRETTTRLRTQRLARDTRKLQKNTKRRGNPIAGFNVNRIQNFLRYQKFCIFNCLKDGSNALLSENDCARCDAISDESGFCFTMSAETTTIEMPVGLPRYSVRLLPAAPG